MQRFPQTDESEAVFEIANVPWLRRRLARRMNEDGETITAKNLRASNLSKRTQGHCVKRGWIIEVDKPSTAGKALNTVMEAAKKIAQPEPPPENKEDAELAKEEQPKPAPKKRGRPPKNSGAQSPTPKKENKKDE